MCYFSVLMCTLPCVYVHNDIVACVSSICCVAVGGVNALQNELGVSNVLAILNLNHDSVKNLNYGHQKSINAHTVRVSHPFLRYLLFAAHKTRDVSRSIL